MKRNNKTWIRQLSESYIRQTINEMAMIGPASAEADRMVDKTRVRREGIPTRAGGYRDQAEELHIARYRFNDLLRDHPTKIFDQTGQHIGNIEHTGLDGKPLDASVKGHTPESIEAHEAKISEAARTLNDHIDTHNANVGDMEQRGIYSGNVDHRFGDEYRPHASWL